MEVIWGHKICVLYTYKYKLCKLTNKYNVSTYFVIQLYRIKPRNWIYKYLDEMVKCSLCNGNNVFCNGICVFIFYNGAIVYIL